MRKLYLLKTFLLACLFSIVGGGMAWAETVTDILDFSSMGFANQTVITNCSSGPDKVSVSFNKGTHLKTAPTYYTSTSKGSGVRVYSGNYFTVTVPKGKVLKNIVITFGKSDGSNVITVSEGTYDTNKKTWTPSTAPNSVKFTIGGESGYRQIQALAITYEGEGGGDSSPYFRFAKTDYSVMLITAFTAPTVETNVEGKPTYSSSVPSVATVDSQTGAVTLEALGTTTITATLGKYTASYTLTVTPLPATVFAPVTAQSEVVDGGTYIVLNKDGNKAMGERAIVNNKAKNFLTSATVALNSGLYTESVDGTNEPYAFTLEADGDYFRLKHGSEYLYNEKSDDTDTYWNTYDGTNADGYRWTIDMRTEKSSPIFNSNKKSPRQLGYNAQAPRFATYSTSKTSYSAVLYRQYSASDLQLTISDAGYATYYSDKAFVVPAGMEATTVTAANDNGTLTMAWEYQAGSIVPAETAVLLRGEAKTYNTCQLNDYTVAAPTGNLLHGSVEAATTTGGAKYYKLTYATIGGQRTLGFFWGAEDGAAFTNAAGKAYLALPAEAAANGYRLDGGDVTGIGQIATDAQGNGQVYSISGVRMDGSKRLPAGIYVINGRKVIVK